MLHIMFAKSNPSHDRLVFFTVTLIKVKCNTNVNRLLFTCEVQVQRYHLYLVVRETPHSSAGPDASLDAISVTQGGKRETPSGFDRLQRQFSIWYWSSCASWGFVLVLSLMPEMRIRFDMIQVRHKCFKTASKSPERLSSGSKLTVHKLSQYFQILYVLGILQQCCYGLSGHYYKYSLFPGGFSDSSGNLLTEYVSVRIWQIAMRFSPHGFYLCRQTCRCYDFIYSVNSLD